MLVIWLELAKTHKTHHLNNNHISYIVIINKNCTGNNGIDWKWPENYLPAEVYINDDDKMAVITEVQRCIGISKKNYMTMSKATQFDLDKCTILRYLEGRCLLIPVEIGETFTLCFCNHENYSEAIL